MLDIWTDINMTAWLGIVLYVVLDDGYKKFPLDFIWCILPLGIQNSSIDLKLLRLSGPHCYVTVGTFARLGWGGVYRV